MTRGDERLALDAVGDNKAMRRQLPALREQAELTHRRLRRRGIAVAAELLGRGRLAPARRCNIEYLNANNG